MKKNMQTLINRLEIDPNLQPLIRQLWKHCYRTIHSCEGHGEPAYIAFWEQSGDGWFEKNAKNYGFIKRVKHDCCLVIEKILRMKQNRQLDSPQRKAGYCVKCGSGLSGVVAYDGNQKLV